MKLDKNSQGIQKNHITGQNRKTEKYGKLQKICPLAD